MNPIAEGIGGRSVFGGDIALLRMIFLAEKKLGVAEDEMIMLITTRESYARQ